MLENTASQEGFDGRSARLQAEPWAMKVISRSLLMLPFLLYSIFAQADILIECQSPAVPNGELWIKISATHQILPITDEAWLESDEVSVFKKLSEPLKLEHYLKTTSVVTADGSAVLELETAVEVLRLQITKDQKTGHFEIDSKSDETLNQNLPLECKPDQVPSPH